MRAVHPVAVALSWDDVRQVAVPDEGVLLVQFDATFGAGVVEQTQLDLLGDLREDREIRPGPVVRGAQGIWVAGPDL
jgi:hypothetical protein